MTRMLKFTVLGCLLLGIGGCCDEGCEPSSELDALKERVAALEAHQAQVERWAAEIDKWVQGEGDSMGAAEWLLEIEPLICGLLPVSDRPVWCVDGDTPPPPSPPGCIFGMC